MDVLLSNIFLVLYILAWFIAFLYINKHKPVFGAGSFIVVTYICYAIISFFLFNNKMSLGEYEELSLFPFVYLFSVLYLFIQPVTRYNETNRIHRPNMTILKGYIILYIISALLTLPNTLAHIQEGLFLIMTSEEGGAELYNLSKDGVADHSLFVGLTSAVFNIISDFGVLLFYYYLTLSRRNKLLTIGLVISPFISILYSLSSGLRTEATMKLLIIVTTYFLLKPNIDNKIRKIISLAGFMLIGLVVVVMSILTYSRFRNFSGGVSYEVERYIGCANLNFNNYGLDAGGIRYGDRTANEFKRILQFDNVPKDLMATRDKYHSMKIDDASFVTFVGDFTLDYGPFFGAAILICFTFLMKRLTWVPKGKPIHFHQLVLVYLVMSISVQGGMYLFYYSYKQNYVLIAYLLTYFIFKLSSRPRMQVISESN